MMSSSIDFSNSDKGWARSLYWAHGQVSEPLYRVLEYRERFNNPLTSHLYDNLPTRTQEMAYRFFGPSALAGAVAYLYARTSLFTCAMTAVGMLALEVGRTGLHHLSCAAQKKNYIHVRTKVPEIRCPEPKVMTWNILGFPAGGNYRWGGTNPLRERFDEIVKVIRGADPDIVVLQECLMDGKIPEAVIEAFKDRYAHFFIHNGPNKFGIESGLLVMTKCAVHEYSFTPFENDNWTMTRGFATLTVKADPLDQKPTFAVFGTHMEAGSDPADALKRKQQLAQIHKTAKEMTDVECVIVGDTNINAQIEQERQDANLDQILLNVHSAGEPTCTNELLWQRKKPEDQKGSKLEWINQIAKIKRAENDTEDVVYDLKVIPAFQYKDGKADTKTALSDHNAMVATLKVRGG